MHSKNIIENLIQKLYDSISFSLMQTYDIGHKGKLMGVIHTLGAIYTCCSDTTIKILEPSVRPDVIATLSNSTAEVAEVSCKTLTNNGT